ncbi:hypothetical protein EYF80_058106 [Liparis tanakae]|uniref:Uncharacterized protein n=1 Tax=Liparis tanakae TaxID=230148 RepID=A0A4Z2ESB7_9TELE|nr:hypothetical protein EYF80_058106 [Liparis tanakae]
MGGGGGGGGGGARSAPARRRAPTRRSGGGGARGYVLVASCRALAARRPPETTHLVQQLPAEVPSQEAEQRLAVPAQRHPAEVLLEAELRPLEAGLRQRGDQEAALAEAVRTWRLLSPFNILTIHYYISLYN